MTLAALEERLCRLEELVAGLVAEQKDGSRPKGWRFILGMPPPPDVERMKKIDAAGQAIRERERRAARRTSTRRRRTAQ